MEKDEKQNLWSVKVSTEEQNDIREKVFYKMSEINSPIYEMKSRKYHWRKSSLNLLHPINQYLQTKSQIHLKIKILMPVDQTRQT